MKVVNAMIASLLSILLFGVSHAQEPVRWSYQAKKLSGNFYEIHLTATIASPWHLYSQQSPEDAGLPTSIHFARNPLVTLQGTVQEKGKLISKHEEVFDATVKYYEKTVDFVQTIKLKGNFKTKVSGEIEYMVCHEQQCLPPKRESFVVALK